MDEDLRGSEADLLYEVDQSSGETSLWSYILLEHQSTPDRWMRFRLLKYCCRIWDRSFRDQPDQRALRAIVPLVFYQGERSWSYSSEFADLFAKSVRNRCLAPSILSLARGTRYAERTPRAKRRRRGDEKGRLKSLSSNPRPFTPHVRQSAIPSGEIGSSIRSSPSRRFCCKCSMATPRAAIYRTYPAYTSVLQPTARPARSCP